MGNISKDQGRKGGGKVVFIGGVLLLLFGLTLLVMGGALWNVNRNLDSEGYALSKVLHINAPSHIFTIGIRADNPSGITGLALQFMKHEDVSQAKWIVTSSTGKELFVGFASSKSLESPLSAAEYNSIDWSWDAGVGWATLDRFQNLTYNKGMSSPPLTLMSASFWLTTDKFTGATTIHYDPYWGSPVDIRTLVIMNADGSAGVDANLQFGWRHPALEWLPYVLIPIGAIILLVGVLQIMRRRTK